nr:hypothetical protein CFP56_53515 [Quercus suber]
MLASACKYSIVWALRTLAHFVEKSAKKAYFMAPIFSLDDGSSSNFDATLVPATMLPQHLAWMSMGKRWF